MAASVVAQCNFVAGLLKKNLFKPFLISLPLTKVYVNEFLSRSQHDDRYVERQCHQHVTYDCYWWLDKLGLLWFSHK